MIDKMFDIILQIQKNHQEFYDQIMTIFPVDIFEKISKIK